MKPEACIVTDPARRSTKLYIIGQLDAQHHWCLVPRDDMIVMETHGIGVELEPLLEWSGLVDVQFREVLQAIVDECHKHGIKHEDSSENRFILEGKLQVMEETLDHERGQFGSLLGRVLGASMVSPPPSAPSPAQPLKERNPHNDIK